MRSSKTKSKHIVLFNLIIYTVKVSKLFYVTRPICKISFNGDKLNKKKR